MLAALRRALPGDVQRTTGSSFCGCLGRHRSTARAGNHLRNLRNLWINNSDLSRSPSPRDRLWSPAGRCLGRHRSTARAGNHLRNLRINNSDLSRSPSPRDRLWSPAGSLGTGGSAQVRLCDPQIAQITQILFQCLQHSAERCRATYNEQPVLLFVGAWAGIGAPPGLGSHPCNLCNLWINNSDLSRSRSPRDRLWSPAGSLGTGGSAQVRLCDPQITQITQILFQCLQHSAERCRATYNEQPVLLFVGAWAGIGAPPGLGSHPCNLCNLWINNSDLSRSRSPRDRPWSPAGSPGTAGSPQVR